MSKTMTSWQPIETAPRDGRRLLLWDASGDVAKFGCWSDKLNGWKTRWSFYAENPPPTYWMEIEPPPAGGRDE